nr:restriction endonuclease subunit S [uncultured Cohaesibacter sp.]
MVPEGWKFEKLGDVLDRVVRPVSVQPEREYTQIGIRSHGKGTFIKDSVKGEELGNKRVFWIVPECLIVNIVFAWEQAVAETDQSMEGLIASHRFPMFRGKSDRADVSFLRYLFLTPKGKHLLELASPGGAGRNKTLGQKEFERLTIQLPPLPEQKKIAEILSTWDRAIEVAEQQLENARLQKKALMQQLLTGTRRLPGFDGDWKTVKLGDSATLVYGKSPKDVICLNGAYPVIGTGGETGKTNDWMFEGENVVIGRKGTIDKPSFVKGRFWPIDTTFVCSAKPGYQIGYLFWLISALDLRRFNEASGVPSLSRDTLNSIKIRLPDQHEQRAVCEVLGQASCLEKNEEAKITHLRTEKRALMQQLLTGRKRVKV